MTAQTMSAGRPQRLLPLLVALVLLLETEARSTGRRLSGALDGHRQLQEKRLLWEKRVLQAGTMRGSSRTGSSVLNPAERFTDTRSPVPDTTAYPFNSVGILRLYSNNGIGLCSGALIAPQFVLTAAHCLLNPDNGATVEGGDFTPGYNPNANDTIPFGRARITATFVPAAFAACGIGGYGPCHAAYDFALMQLTSSFDEWFGYSWNMTDAGSMVVNTAGYPGDDADCQQSDNPLAPFAGCQMYHSSCTQQTIRPGAAVGYMACTSFSGQSGSPVWLYNTTSGERSIRGVLTHRVARVGASNVAGPGSFTIMSEDIFSDITSWMMQAEEQEVLQAQAASEQASQAAG